MLFLGKKSSHHWLMRSSTLNLVLMLWQDACIPLSIPLSFFPQWPVKTQHCNPESLPWPWISSSLTVNLFSYLFSDRESLNTTLSSLFFSALCDVRKKGGELCDRRTPTRREFERFFASSGFRAKYMRKEEHPRLTHQFSIKGLGRDDAGATRASFVMLLSRYHSSVRGGIKNFPVFTFLLVLLSSSWW
jgi:hypothetical protein